MLEECIVQCESGSTQDFGTHSLTRAFAVCSRNVGTQMKAH